MKTSDRLNVELADYLDQKFESVSIFTSGPGSLSSPGPDTVWFDVDPSSEGWLVIRRLQEFLSRYSQPCHLRPYTYLRDLPRRDLPRLGWSLTIPPPSVGLLAAFILLKEAEEAEHRAEREAFEAEEASYRALGGGPPMSTREQEASPFEAAAFGDTEKGATL